MMVFKDEYEFDDWLRNQDQDNWQYIIENSREDKDGKIIVRL